MTLLNSSFAVVFVETTLCTCMFKVRIALDQPLSHCTTSQDWPLIGHFVGD